MTEIMQPFIISYRFEFSMFCRHRLLIHLDGDDVLEDNIEEDVEDLSDSDENIGENGVSLYEPVDTDWPKKSSFKSSSLFGSGKAIVLEWMYSQCVCWKVHCSGLENCPVIKASGSPVNVALSF